MPVQIHTENAIPFGFEPEFSGNINPSSQAQQYRTDGVEGFTTCPDCGVVNSETKSPILVDCAFAWAAVEEMFNACMTSRILSILFTRNHAQKATHISAGLWVIKSPVA